MTNDDDRESGFQSLTRTFGEYHRTCYCHHVLTKNAIRSAQPSDVGEVSADTP